MTEILLSPKETGQRGAAGQITACPRCGSLPSILLAETGQDVRLCARCANCNGLMVPGMDLTIGEVIRGAARDDTRVLASATLSACEDLLLRPMPCTAGPDLTSILLCLRREAELRGLAAPPEAPPP